jgi:hypothetical protein
LIGTVPVVPRFKVTVTSDSPVETGQALNGAHIPTIGPVMARFRDAPGNDWTISDHLTAVLDAPDATTAVRLVQEVIGDDSEVIGGAELWGSS